MLQSLCQQRCCRIQSHSYSILIVLYLEVDDICPALDQLPPPRPSHDFARFAWQSLNMDLFKAEI